jgi:hypothetical protein
MMKNVVLDRQLHFTGGTRQGTCDFMTANDAKAKETTHTLSD